MDENFLLSTRAARTLFHDFAKNMPIFDFHCHLPVQDIAENRKFQSLTEAWLGGDHYKWRAMRGSGVPERLITGNASDRDKFMEWAAVVPSTIGNPLYHWTHLELKRHFGIMDTLLSADTGGPIYDRCTALLSTDAFRVRALLTKMNVKVVCTTDDPADLLEHHAALAADPSFPVTVVPTFRPDAVRGIENPAVFSAWVDRLARAARVEIGGFQDLIDALKRRHDFFHANGCRASDHGIEEPYAEDCTEEDADRIFQAVRHGTSPGEGEIRAWRSIVSRELARMDAASDWVQQLHLGALRNINTRFMRALGPDTGFDTIGDFPLARPLARYLDRLDAAGTLPKTILYCLNPADNALLASMIGAFPQEGVRGKMQFGSAWWFNDQKHGMEDQLRALADRGLLARFVGMVTDSRSFLSFPRHEYFRRILCAMLGSGIEAGEIPADVGLVGGMVQDICYHNAIRFFGIPLKAR
jgi:glucuronate isomerase